MGIFGKLFKGPEIDQVKSADSKQKMRRLFDSVVPDGGQYQLVAAYTEDAKRFNYGLVHGSKTTYGSLIVGWKEGGGPHGGGRAHSSGPLRLRQSGNLPPFRNQKGLSEQVPHGCLHHLRMRHYLAINTFEWLEDEKLFILRGPGTGRAGL